MYSANPKSRRADDFLTLTFTSFYVQPRHTGLSCRRCGVDLLGLIRATEAAAKKPTIIRSPTPPDRAGSETRKR